MTRPLTPADRGTLHAVRCRRARRRADLTGHWEGMVQTPEMTIDFQIDVARGSKWQLRGHDQPAERTLARPAARRS